MKIERRTITCPSLKEFKRPKLRQMARMRKANESVLHTYLKLCAWDILHGMTKHCDLIAWECMYYTPFVEHKIEEVSSLGEVQVRDVDEPQVLFGNEGNFPLSYGKSYRVDVRSFETVVEVGQTWPFNLLTPLLDGLADEAIWVPYPKGVEPGTFNLSAGGLGDVSAYAMSLV